jgi:hypothetical protein
MSVPRREHGRQPRVPRREHGRQPRGKRRRRPPLLLIGRAFGPSGSRAQPRPPGGGASRRHGANVRRRRVRRRPMWPAACSAGRWRRPPRRARGPSLDRVACTLGRFLDDLLAALERTWPVSLALRLDVVGDRAELAVLHARRGDQRARDEADGDRPDRESERVLLRDACRAAGVVPDLLAVGGGVGARVKRSSSLDRSTHLTSAWKAPRCG